MKPPDLASLLPRFFAEHLIQQRNLSRYTISAYRDTFRLFLRFLQKSRRAAPNQLQWEALSAQNVLDFLAHLEKDRRNSVRSRNARLAAIRSFVHYASDLLGPTLPEPTQRILAISFKRHVRPILSFLAKDEVEAILKAADTTWTGQRDHLLFLLLYNTGARVSEIVSARVRDALTSGFRCLQLQGKGRKQRTIPLWPKTQRQLRRWVKENNLSPESPLLPTRVGQSLTRSGVAWQLRQLVRKAFGKQSSAKQRRISPHTFRHTTAMHLLQSGVAAEVIALWLGHESPNTTHLYVEADLEMKRKALDAIQPPKTKCRSAKLDEPLLRFLENL